MLQDALQDLRGAMRLLQKNPGFTAVAVLTLAIGIGANTAFFSALNHVVFQPLPYAEPEQLVRVFTTNTVAGFTRINLSYPDMLDFSANSRLLAGIAGYSPTGVNFSGEGEPERLDGARVTASFFEVVKLQPLQGRVITPADQAAGERVAVLSERLWRRRFGGADITGRRVILNAQEYTLIGVVPHLSDMPEVWVPLDAGGVTQQRRNRFLTAVARMKPGVTVEQLQTELTGIAANLQAAYPDSNKNISVRAEGLKSVIVNATDTNIFAMLLAIVTLVLAIACANIANLLLSRSVIREREIAVRAALGASRLRLLRQLLTESLALSLIGGLLGIAVGYAGVQLLVSIIPAGVPRVDEIRMDGWSIAYAAALALLTGVLFGLAPALQLSRVGLLDSLKQGGHGTAGAAGGRRRLSKALVVAQVAIALALLICAGLFAKTFYTVLQVDLGFQTEGVLTFRATLPRVRYDTEERIAQLYSQMAEQLSALPGVKDVGLTSRLPMGQGSLWRGYMRDGDVPPPQGESPVALYHAVSPNYLRTVGIPIVAGRGFEPRDEAAEPKVIILNQLLAERLWPGGNAVGRRIRIHTDEDFPREVIGVAGNTRHSLQNPIEAQVFVPHRQTAWNTMTAVLLTEGDPMRIRESAQRVVREIDPNLPVYEVRTLSSVVDQGRERFRTLASLLGSFGAAALGLAAMGIYGVVSYGVRQRTQEIGVRIALGAQPRQLLGMMLRQGFVPVGIGLLIGLAMGFGVNQVLAKQLPRFVTIQPLIVLSVAALLGAIGVIACLAPARRAARVDPLQALRHE